MVQTGQYTQVPGSSPLAARECGLSQPFVADVVFPDPGRVAYYLATGVAESESDLGTDGANVPRPHHNPCP